MFSRSNNGLWFSILKRINAKKNCWLVPSVPSISQGTIMLSITDKE